MYDLLQSTKRVARGKSCEFGWVRDERICVRQSNGTLVIYINSETDLAKLI